MPGFYEREFGVAHELCEQELREALLPHRRRANELIASVHRLVERLFDVPFEPQQQEIALAKAEQPILAHTPMEIRWDRLDSRELDRQIVPATPASRPNSPANHGAGGVPCDSQRRRTSVEHLGESEAKRSEFPRCAE